MAGEQRYRVTFQQTRDIYLPSFAAIIRRNIEKSGYVYQSADFVKDTEAGTFEFYISDTGKGNESKLTENLKPHGRINRMEKMT